MNLDMTNIESFLQEEKNFHLQETIFNTTNMHKYFYKLDIFLYENDQPHGIHSTIANITNPVQIFEKMLFFGIWFPYHNNIPNEELHKHGDIISKLKVSIESMNLMNDDRICPLCDFRSARSTSFAKKLKRKVRV